MQASHLVNANLEIPDDRDDVTPWPEAPEELKMAEATILKLDDWRRKRSAAERFRSLSREHIATMTKQEKQAVLLRSIPSDQIRDGHLNKLLEVLFIPRPAETE